MLNKIRELKYLVINTDNLIKDDDKKNIKKELLTLKKQISELQLKVLCLGRLLDYDNLKQQGFNKEQIKKFYNEDNITILNAQNHLKEQLKKDRDYMFGYPTNMLDESSVISYLRWIESQMFYINSCGTAYETGNYRMSKKNCELNIINKVMNNLKINNDVYWGYITTGGTEGNLWGIREGFTNYPKGILYFSESTHYSAAKIVSCLSVNKYNIIKSKNGAIDTQELISKILANKSSKKNGVILLLNYGTTTLGSVDDVEYIFSELKKHEIPFYVHLDAALYGGIPNNQINSPANKLSYILNWGIDSVSISLHKYLGLPKTNGILLAKTHNNLNFIEYIGQNDVTICGSRDFLYYTTLQRVTELYERNNYNDYYKNIHFFEKLLSKENIEYEKGNKNGNIFIFNKPSDYICKKYQLSEFTINNKKKVHVIIFPFHKQKIIKSLIRDLKKDGKCENNGNKI